MDERDRPWADILFIAAMLLACALSGTLAMWYRPHLLGLPSWAGGMLVAAVTLVVMSAGILVTFFSHITIDRGQVLATTYHVPGSGNAKDPDNFVARARLDAMRRLATDRDEAVLYGRRQEGLPQSEATSGLDYLMPPGGAWVDHPALRLEEGPKSVSQTMAVVAGYIHASLLTQREVASPEYGLTPQWDRRHVVVLNWPYVPRAHYLLAKQWGRLYPEIPWDKAEALVRFSPVGGTLKEDLYFNGWRAWPRWLWRVAAREAGAWVKALRDPYDEHLNQDRWSAKVFH